MQRALQSHSWTAGQDVRVRMGIHSGEASRTAVGLVGLEVHRAARIAAVAHGGQVVLSAATAALLPDPLPAGARIRDLGLHRLKDLGRAEQIFQVDADGLPTAFPPLASLDNPKLLNNLPAQVSSFIGRDAELAEVRRLVTASRLVTLTGSGGSGKTRLGLQVAAGLLDGSGDGVWFADLAPLHDQDLVAVTVANVLGVNADPDQPLITALADAIGRRALLVLLDNCEHVIDACAKLADALLRSCPNIALLATSREPLGIDGERVYRVPSMGTPADGDDPDTIRATEAVRLFADRAERHGVRLAWDRPAAEVAGRICRRLDGIPLAIELGAARLRVMSLADLDARLDQRFSILTGGSRAALRRQQTLRAMVDWSWDLLTSSERHVLASLSVFAGGFDPAAVEAVTAGDIVTADEVLEHLGTLVDKNLVQFDDTGAGRPATGCWKPCGSTPRASSKGMTGRRRTRPGPRTATTTWPWRKRRPRSSSPASRPAGWTASTSSSTISAPRSPSAWTGPTRRPASGWSPRSGFSGRHGGTPRKESTRSGRSSTSRRPGRRRRCARRPWPPRPTCWSRRAATRPPPDTATRRWPWPAPPGTTTWRPTC